MINEKDPFGTPDADGWYEWKGDDMIRPAGMVEVIYRTNVGADRAPASAFFWGHSGLPCDIVKWRPAQ